MMALTGGRASIDLISGGQQNAKIMRTDGRSDDSTLFVLNDGPEAEPTLSVKSGHISRRPRP